MRQMLAGFYFDERGALLLTEWLFLATILLIGIVPSVFMLRGNVGQPALKGCWSPGHPIVGR
jgi:hypothetical protein